LRDLVEVLVFSHDLTVQLEVKAENEQRKRGTAQMALVKRNVIGNHHVNLDRLIFAVILYIRAAAKLRKLLGLIRHIDARHSPIKLDELEECFDGVELLERLQGLESNVCLVMLCHVPHKGQPVWESKGRAADKTAWF